MTRSYEMWLTFLRIIATLCVLMQVFMPWPGNKRVAFLFSIFTVCAVITAIWMD